MMDSSRAESRRCRRLGFLAAMALFGGFAVTAWGWTAPLEISASSSSERSTPRVARGNVTGNLYVVYVNKSSPWQCWFRQKSAAGVWSATELLSGSQFATRMDVAEDSQGRPHVMYASYNTSGSLDLVHLYRTGSSWTSEYVGATTSYEDQPHLATDSAGVIHVVFTRTSAESTSGDVVYRVWANGSWGAETIIGHTDQSYYRRPDICVDPANNVHVTWGDKSGSVYKIRYRKLSGGAWAATQDIGSNTTFPGYSKIAAFTTSSVVVVWDDANVTYNYSNNGGSTWAFALSGDVQGQTLSADRAPVLDAGSTAVHMITTLAPNNRGVGYRQWNGSSWTAQQTVFSNSTWKGWPDVAVDASGTAHAVWDEAYGSSTADHYIAYSTSAADTVPPQPVSGFFATAAHNAVYLGWTNPSDPDFERTIVRVSTSGYPSSATAGSSVADLPNTPGSSDNCTHSGVINGTRYYYAAFAKDANGLYSVAATASAVPFVPPDIDRDGDVDISDFGMLQMCLTGQYEVQSDPACQSSLLDNDMDVDDADVAIFFNCLSGPGISYVPACAG